MKRMHPAGKLVRAMDLWFYKTYEQKQRIVVRHVKPILDALEVAHDGDPCRPTIPCPVCRLLAAWKENL